MPNTQDASKPIVPSDLALAVQPDIDKNYFNVTVKDLKINKNYAIQFQWIELDGKLGSWSPGFIVNTSTESVPTAPTNTVTGGAGFIKISLPTFPANALRVDVRIAGGTFGNGTVVAESFTSAGVKTIAAAGSSGQGSAYVVTLLTVTPSKINGDPSSPVTVYVTDPSAALVVTAPQDPFAPTVRSGLASVIVEWSGKKSDGADLTVTGFNGAKVHIGTTSNFTPSADNWVHTLNFANGSNRVSIGVGSIIDKTAGTTLQYETAYHVKLVAVNASGTLSSAISASNNPVTVAKLPASEIDTGILTAGASITAGVAQGQRVVISGSVAPLIIYGTDGTTKLLEYVTGGTAGSLTIKGSGTFTGDISASSGTIGGITLNGSGLSSTNFSISPTGLITAQSGTIGGWTINGSVLESTATAGGQIRLTPSTANGGKIALLLNGTEKITIDAVEGIVGPNKTVAGNTGPAFKITPDGTAEFRGAIYASTGVFSGAVQGAVITSTGTSYLGQGTLTINSGYINHTLGFYMSAGEEGLYFDTNSAVDNAYLMVHPTIGTIIGQGNYTGDLQIRLNNADLAGYTRGYLFHSLYDQFPDITTLYTTSTFGTPGSTVTINANNRLSRGRTLYTGNFSSTATLDSNLSGAFTGDLYFSTA